MTTFYTSCPEVGRTQEVFVEHVTVAGERRRIEFTKPIIWLQQSESRLEYRHGGQLLDETSSHNDFYGYLSSVRGRIEDAGERAKHFGITINSSLELVVVTKVFQSPATENEETIRDNRQKAATRKNVYLYVPDSWRQEAMEDGYTIYPRLNARVLSEEVVWSSKNTTEQNAALADRFREAWKVIEPA